MQRASYFRYGHTALWKGGMSSCRDCISKTRIIVLQPGLSNRTSPLYFSARSSCSLSSGWYFSDLSLLLFPAFCFLMFSSSTLLERTFNFCNLHCWKLLTQDMPWRNRWLGWTQCFLQSKVPVGFVPFQARRKRTRWIAWICWICGWGDFWRVRRKGSKTVHPKSSYKLSCSSPPLR